MPYSLSITDPSQHWSKSTRCRRLIALCALTTGLLTVATAARAGELKGKVRLRSSLPVQTAAINPYPGTLGGGAEAPAHQPGSSPAEVVIFIEGVSGTRSPRSDNQKLHQVSRSFQPRVIGITVGETVEFPNMDLVFHNVFSYSKTKRFDLGHYGKGKSKSVTFDKPGLVKVFCDIHSTMSAFIYVADTPYITQPGKDGSYSIKDVPEGTYTVRVWHPEHGESSDVVTIGNGATRHDINM